MVSADAAHGAPPCRSASGPREQAPPSATPPRSPPRLAGAPEGSRADLSAPRTGRVVDGGLDAWSAPTRGDDSPGSEPKSESRWARRSRRRAMQSRGVAEIEHVVASGRIIHAGVKVSVPSLRTIVTCSTPAYSTRRPVEATVRPASG